MKYIHAPYWRGLPYSRAIRLSRGTTKLNLKNYTPVHVANRSFVILHPPSTSFTLVSFKLSLRAPKPAFHRINLPLRPIATVFQGVECGFVLFSLFYFSSLFAYFSFFSACSSGKSRLISAFNENVRYNQYVDQCVCIWVFGIAIIVYRFEKIKRYQARKLNCCLSNFVCLKIEPVENC